VSLSRQILVGLVAGVALGLFLGELAAPFQILADAYVRLLQMTVLPYMIVSLIAGLGGLSAEQAKTMLTRVGAILGVLWGLSIGFAFLTPLAFPSWETASFFSTSQLHKPEPFDFLGLYIPTNPFNSLANNVVPAVVLFCIVVGVALIGVKDKERVLEPLHALARTIGEVNRFVVKLTPIGLFAIGASLAGTLRLEEIERIQIYLIVYGAIALLLLLWVLPGLVGVLTPARYREVVGPARDALLTAFMTSSLFVVLPMLGECARDILRRHAAENPEAEEYPDVIVPASFNFPHSAKLLSLSFLPFAAWFAEVSIGGVVKHLQLALVGLLTFFGSLNAAVPFLLDLFRIPQDTFQLFLATGVVNARVGSAVAAMHTLVVAILGSFALAGLLRVDRKRLVRYLTVTVVLTVGTLGGLRLLFATAFEQAYTKDEVLAAMHRIRGGVEAVVHREPVPTLAEPREGSLLARIRARGVLRVGYTPDNPPYSFFNASGDLVGFDVEMAHDLAWTIGTTLEFVPVDFPEIQARMSEGCCDLMMSGVVVTPERAEELVFSVPYLEEHLAFVTADHERATFAHREAIRAGSPLRIGVMPTSYVVTGTREYAPEAEVIALGSKKDIFGFLEGQPTDLDAVVMPAERGAIWSIRHPRLSVVVPDPPIMTIPLAYVVGERDERLRLLLNTWIDLLQRDGTIDELRDYWVYGKAAEEKRPRWSIIRNVLGWVD
jgi:Na+/H+-dicarboxylate symporter/ABC-type amino acid transport substrate-binding protein